MQLKKAQVSMEYLLITSFVTFIVIGIFGLAFLYSGGIKDRIKINQVHNFANKIIDNAEITFYSGSPSKSTISTYLPEGVQEINIIQDHIIISTQTNSGVTKTSFSSRVPISGNISASFGVKKIQIEAKENGVEITQV